MSNSRCRLCMCMVVVLCGLGMSQTAISNPNAPMLEAASIASDGVLVGSNCSYTTGKLAQRVLDEGKPWTYTGRLVPSSNDLSTHVAAPFTVGLGDTWVVANQVLEDVTDVKVVDLRLQMTGMLLVVDEVRYFVLTRYREAS